MVMEGFGLDHLKLKDVPDPKVVPREILVRIRAASLNYRDLLTVKGKRSRAPAGLGKAALRRAVARGGNVRSITVFISSRASMSSCWAQNISKPVL